ncbi:26S proteasome non-ATPase regulatory subunit 13-like [Periplaneta americana]|uniref:26S proteasome non-ATPase regulatory subunit 13-like n=1 Tax=Periplaneta americana TaxID=6978 RepID=UPI0037E765E0
MAHLVEKLAYPTQAVQLLEEAESCVENSDGALALYKTLRAEYLFTHMGDVKESKRVLDQAKKLLRGIPVTAIVHGRFYSLSSRWHESQGHYEKVYRKILRYLDCVHVENIPKDESLRLSKALVTAALVGKKLFDLGEVVCHPVMTALSPEDKWMLHLLHHMNEGRLDAVLDMEETCTTHPLLRLHWDNILDKAQLLCLMQMFFTRHPQQRVLPLSDVAGQMRMPESDVELLLIRAMAQGLIRGSIDQVESIVRVIWVRPRMLHREQLIPFLNRLDDWCSEIKSLESWAVEKIEQLEALS